MSIAEFFHALYPGGLPEGTWGYVWTLPGRTSHWGNTIDQLTASAARACEANQDVYFGVALSRTRGTRSTRVKATEAAAIPGLWLDLDYADSVHKKPNLPDRADALEFLLSGPEKPSIVIHSGHGYQAWWLFDSPWVFKDATEVAEAQALTQAWCREWQERAARHGWDVDSTFDLSRVLRVPGTINRKADPVPVELSAGYADLDNIPRYERRYLAGVPSTTPRALNGATPAGTPAGTPSQGGFVLSADANPPLDKWMALSANEPRAALSFARNRPDLTDQSPSSYDMSLASFAVAAGWTDQEVVNLLIAARRHHGDDLKLREDYYRRTLQRARASLAAGAAPGEVTLDGATPEEKCAAISSMLGIDVVRFVKYPLDPSPVYQMDISLPSGDIEKVMLGGIEAITNQTTFRNRVAAATNLIVPKVSAAVWDTRAQMILNALEVVDVGAEGREDSLLTVWLSEYLSDNRPAEEDWQMAAMSGRPFRRDGGTYISTRGFGSYLRTIRNEVIKPRDLVRMLRAYGATTETLNVSVHGRASTRSVWRLPERW